MILKAPFIGGIVALCAIGAVAVAQVNDGSRSLDPVTEDSLNSLLNEFEEQDAIVEGDGRRNAEDIFARQTMPEEGPPGLAENGDIEGEDSNTGLVPMFVPGPPEGEILADPGIAGPEDQVTETEFMNQPFVRLRGLDKISGDSTELYVEAGTNAIFGGLRVTVRACHQTPPTEPPESIAYLEIEDYGFKVKPEDIKGDEVEKERRVFHGWMYASSPGIHALEHPIYDIWVIRCMTELPDLSSVESESQAS